MAVSEPPSVRNRSVPPFSAKPCSAGSHPNTAAPLDRRSVEAEESRILGTHARGPNPGNDRADAHDSRPAADKDELCVPNRGIAATSAGSADPLGGHRLMVGCGRRAAGHGGFSHQKLELLRYVGTASREVAASPPTAHRESFASSPGSPGSIATDEYAFSFDSPSGG